jgi:hypothetical protein
MTDPWPASLPLLDRIARAIREELGSTIEAYPGLRSPQGAEPINRAFQAVVRELAKDDRPSRVSHLLRSLAESRLALEGWDARLSKGLIEEEPGSPDDWLVFLILSSREQIEPLLDPESEP